MHSLLEPLCITKTQSREALSLLFALTHTHKQSVEEVESTGFCDAIDEFVTKDYIGYMSLYALAGLYVIALVLLVFTTYLSPVFVRGGLGLGLGVHGAVATFAHNPAGACDKPLALQLTVHPVTNRLTAYCSLGPTACLHQG